MPRSLPFSGKQKKEQLKEKRAQKRDAGDPSKEARGGAGRSGGPGGRGGGITEEEGRAIIIGAGGSGSSGAGDGSIPAHLLMSSLGKSGKQNKWSTVFAREDDTEVERRRNASADVLDISKRGQPWTAASDSHAAISHPKGVVLHSVGAAAAAGTSSLSDAAAFFSADSTAIEEEAFQKWLEGIYAQWPRSCLNVFEHSLSVWQQLWHSIATGDVIVLVTDVRNPLWHISPSLYEQVTQELKKPLVIVLNKVDLVPPAVAAAWQSYLEQRFTAAKVVQFSSSGM